jgi:hypothetical protein
MAYFGLILILNRETAGDPVHLVSGLDLSDLSDLGRRRGLGIDVGAGARFSVIGFQRSALREPVDC